LGTGAGLTVINNVGEVVLSLGGTNGDQNIFVKLLSVCSCVGRITFGISSDLLAHRLSRASFFTIALVGMCSMQLYLGFASTVNALYFGICGVGLFYGGLFSMAPTMTADIFGLKFFGTNWGIAGVGPGIGSLLFATVLAGGFYSKFSPDGGKTCNGEDCFRYTFFTLFGLCFIGVCVCLVLVKRVKPIYEKNVRRRA